MNGSDAFNTSDDQDSTEVNDEKDESDDKTDEKDEGNENNNKNATTSKISGKDAVEKTGRDVVVKDVTKLQAHFERY